MFGCFTLTTFVLMCFVAFLALYLSLIDVLLLGFLLGLYLALF